MKKRSIGARLLAFLLAVLLLSGNTGLKAAGREAEVTKEEAAVQEEGTREKVETQEEGTEEEAEIQEETEEEETQIYYEWQTLEEILELCEQGLDLEEFFRYTIWGELTREDIRALVEEGRTLEDLYEEMPMVMSLGDTRTAGFSGAVSAALGNIPALGSGSHGPMLKIHLSGETAFCARFGAACRTGMVYQSVPLSEIGADGSAEQVIRGLLAQYAEAQRTYTGPVNYIMTQAGVWLVQNGQWTGNPEGMANAIAPLFSKTPDCPSTAFAADYFRAIVEWIDLPENQSKIEAIGLEAWANGPNQYLITATGEGGSLEELGPYARVELRKTDTETGHVIAEQAEFAIYEWNGSSYERTETAMNREGDHYVSDDLFRTEENEGKFYLEESLAPHTGSATGYYGDWQGERKHRYEFEISEEMSGDTILISNAGGNFENRRVMGSIRLSKKDIEAEAYLVGDMSHGTAALDGAVYDLYAKEDVIHPDGVTGVVHRKDSLVASGTIQNGSCSFENLYLGSYYLKERQKGETLLDGKKLSYARGYLLDETIYQVTLPYEGEAVREVHREVCSDKEQVIKAKAVLEKVESAAGQGNIRYLEGAGFTIYRIDRLSKASSFVKNADGTYNEESIQAVYLVEAYDQDTPKYDFRGEEEAIAAVYLRDTTLRPDTAHYWQDGEADLEAGKLLPLGGHRYRVAELFSDENGQVVTPYLPYGQYLVVETTVPQDHFMAPPFVLTFREGRTTRILTAGVTEQTPYGGNLLKSSGDPVRPYEAVYFSGVIDNEAVEQLLKICKKDADTGKTVLLADTKFKIARIDEETGEKTYLTHTVYYPETVNREIFSTSETGCLQLPELLSVGLYQIEEIEGPNGFYNDIPGGYVQFRVTTDRKYQALSGNPEGSTLEGAFGERDVLLILEEYENRETKGELTIRKKGEVLTDYREAGLLGRIKAFFGLTGEKMFVYEEQPLAGAEYTIRAAEDIVTQDRQTDTDGNRTLWFRKGETVAVVTTGEEGSVKLYLPLGSYEIEETKAPYGYTRTEERWQVTFTWEHQFQEFIPHSQTITNRRVKAVPEADTGTPGVGIYKTAKENGQPLSGVTFGLYTKDAIYSREGQLLVQAGELLSTCVTGGDGKGVFSVDLPIRDEKYGEKEKQNSGCYEIRELDTPSGIFLDPTPIPVTFLYEGEETEFVILKEQQENESSEVFLSKQDLVYGTELAGARLTVTENRSGKTAADWISDGNPRELRGLAVNESLEQPDFIYTLTELTAPQGYLRAESIRFLLVRELQGEEQKNGVYVYDTGAGSWVRAEDNTVVMKDAPGEEHTEQPEETPGGQNGGRSSSSSALVTAPASGDGMHPELYLFLAFGAGLGITAILKRRQKRF